MNELRIDKDFKDLLPPLTDDEFTRLENDILKDGIRENLLTWNGFIIDGHNRYEIATRHKLDFKTTNKEFNNKQEVIQWMLNNQLGRRNLPKEKRVDIILQADELIKSLYEKGRENYKEGTKLGASITNKVARGSIEPRAKHNTNDEIARMADTSSATVKRMKRIKRENEDLYKDVVEGKKTIHAAYKDLREASNKQGDKRKNETEMVDENVKVKKRERTSNLYNFQNPDLTKDEIEKAMFSANVETIFMHLKEVEMFISRNDNFGEIIFAAINKDKQEFMRYINALELIIKKAKKEIE